MAKNKKNPKPKPRNDDSDSLRKAWIIADQKYREASRADDILAALDALKEQVNIMYQRRFGGNNVERNAKSD